MRAFSFLAGSLVAATALSAAPAQAVTQIPDGTLSIGALFVPTVTTGATNTFSVTNGATFQTAGSGGFSSVVNRMGSMNGTFSFSSTVGASLAQVLPNFFLFDDAAGGNYSFSAASAKTISYSVTPGISSAFAIYLLGSTFDSNLGLGPTATSLTLTFNSTGNSPYSASATLAVPPARTGSVPEPASWALIVLGFGGMGAMMRRPRLASVSFS